MIYSILKVVEEPTIGSTITRKVNISWEIMNQKMIVLIKLGYVEKMEKVGYGTTYQITLVGRNFRKQIEPYVKTELQLLENV